MSVGKSKAPSTPDYTGAAITQSSLSNPNISTPYGSITTSSPEWDAWVKGGMKGSMPTLGPGSTTQSVTLSPTQQALFDNYQKTQLGLSGAGNNLLGSLSGVTGKLDYSGLPTVGQGADEINRNVVDALYKQQTQYLDPQFSQREENLEAKLAAQGLNANDEAYKNALSNFEDSRRMAYSDAMYNAQKGGTAAGVAANQSNLAQAQLGMEQQLQNQLLPLQQIQSILGLSAPNVPGVGGGGQGVDLLGALQSKYNSDLASVNAKNAQTANTFGTLGNLGALGYLLFAS